ELVGGDGRKGAISGGDCGSESSRGTRNLLASAIIECNHENQLVIVLGELLSLVEQPQDIDVEVLALSDHPDTNPVAVQVRKSMADKAAEQRHQLTNLRGRSRPVLCTEGEDRQKGDAEIPGRADRAAQRLNPAPMSLSPRQPARGSPAPVPVHDDGNVPR